LLALTYSITSRIGYGGRDPHVATSSVTESDVRIAVHVHNAVFITFVHLVSVYPKPHRFGQIHTELGSRRLAYFKFRILRGPHNRLGLAGAVHKNHFNVDKRHKLIHQYVVTDASVHDSR